MPARDTFWSAPYPSKRHPVLADNVVATSQPLAAQAGLQMLARGGNAVDAALAAAIALTVVEPTGNGIGSDLFAIVWDGRELHGLNASGRSPARLDAQRLQLLEQMPVQGWDSVAVPGAVSGWAALAERFASLDLATIAEPAIRYARDGFAVGPVTAAAWADAGRVFGGRDEFAPFLPGGAAPSAGQRFGFPDQAQTLAEVARTQGESFYRGRLAEQIAAHAARGGGALTAADLAAHAPAWVAPLSHEFGGAVVHELPPNGQGVAALEALGILARTDLADHAPDSLGAVHLQIEAMKLAFADAHAHVADPDTMKIDAAELLAEERLTRLASGIDPDDAADPGNGAPHPGGTVYLCTADSEGRMVSLIQSNYMGFGSGIVVPGTGISLANRGAGFVTGAEHPNVVAPSKRPFSTIIPGFVSAASGPLMAFGVMGGQMQAQGHVQMMVRTLLWGQNPQAAVDAPRWRVAAGRDVLVETGVNAKVAALLTRRGHDVSTASTRSFGGAQAIWRTGSGWLGASDWRKEGQAVGF